MRSARASVFALSLAGCAGVAPSAWGDVHSAVIEGARSEDGPIVLFFALAGRDASDRMERNALHDPAVLEALAAGGYHTARIDGFVWQHRYAEWVGNGEGMGIVVLEPNGDITAARPGPQDAPELAAFLNLVANRRAQLADLRAMDASADRDFALGTLLLELGARRQAEPLLRLAADSDRSDARRSLAQLYAQDGRLEEARRWLAVAAHTPARALTEGYVLFKERRHTEAAAMLRTALEHELPAAERQRGMLFLGKSLHECGHDGEALAVLQDLVQTAGGSVFGGAALHTIAHIHDKDHGHTH